MKKTFLILPILCLTLFSCKTSKTSTLPTLEGTWQLVYISKPQIPFKDLFLEKKPTITFDLKEKRVSGDNSCNNYAGKLFVKENQINFKNSEMIATMMVCEGKGEQVFMSTLGKITAYTISKDGRTLNFNMGDITMMRFEKLLN